MMQNNKILLGVAALALISLTVAYAVNNSGSITPSAKCPKADCCLKEKSEGNATNCAQKSCCKAAVLPQNTCCKKDSCCCKDECACCDGCKGGKCTCDDCKCCDCCQKDTNCCQDGCGCCDGCKEGNCTCEDCKCCGNCC